MVTSVRDSHGLRFHEMGSLHKRWGRELVRARDSHSASHSRKIVRGMSIHSIARRVRLWCGASWLLCDTALLLLIKWCDRDKTGNQRDRSIERESENDKYSRNKKQLWLRCDFINESVFMLRDIIYIWVFGVNAPLFVPLSHILQYDRLLWRSDGQHVKKGGTIGMSRNVAIHRCTRVDMLMDEWFVQFTWIIAPFYISSSIRRPKRTIAYRIFKRNSWDKTQICIAIWIELQF